MNKNSTFIIWIIVTAAVASSAYFFFPVVQETHDEFPLAVAFASSITQIVASVYVASSLKTFKTGLKIAYTLLALGILIFSLVQLIPSLSVIPALEGIFTDIVLVYALFMAPYAFGALFMYMGMWKFARLLGVHSLWGSFMAILALALVAGSLAVGLLLMLPGSQETLPDFIAFGLMVWCGVFSTAAFVLTMQIRKVIGSVYKDAMFWLAAALAALTLTTFHEFVVKTYFADSPYVLEQFSLVTFLVVGVLFLKAGLAFKETGREFVELPKNPTYIDVVVALARLASPPQAVEKWMDKIRFITSKSDTQKAVTADDKDTILDTYLRIESYLVTDDPLHKHSKEGLRNGLPSQFLQDLAKREPR